MFQSSKLGLKQIYLDLNLNINKWIEYQMNLIYLF